MSFFLPPRRRSRWNFAPEVGFQGHALPARVPPRAEANQEGRGLDSYDLQAACALFSGPLAGLEAGRKVSRGFIKCSETSGSFPESSGSFHKVCGSLHKVCGSFQKVSGRFGESLVNHLFSKTLCFGHVGESPVIHLTFWKLSATFWKLSETFWKLPESFQKFW